MQKPLTFRNRLLAVAGATFLLVPAAMPAHAVSKDMVQLQTEVQQLLDMVQRLQSTLDSRFGVMQNLAQQTSDEAKQTTAAVNSLQQKLGVQNEAVNGKVDTVSGQVQSLSDSVDELKSRIAKLDKTISDMQAQLQTMQSQPQPAQGQPGATMPAGAPNGAGPDAGQAPGQAPVPGSAPQPGAAPGIPAAQQAPPLQATLQAAKGDYNAGRYQVAQSEFQDVIHFYPLDDAAGTAQFYLGEIAYQQKSYATAINDYNAVLEGFGGNVNAPAALLHKGFSLMALDKKQAGVDELRELIRRHPQSPEARTARSKLNGMGVRIAPSPADH
jgi:TolA-binding protein